MLKTTLLFTTASVALKLHKTDDTQDYFTHSEKECKLLTVCITSKLSVRRKMRGDLRGFDEALRLRRLTHSVKKRRGDIRGLGDSEKKRRGTLK